MPMVDGTVARLFHSSTIVIVHFILITASFLRALPSND